MRSLNEWSLRRRLRSSGQALILIVLTFIGLLLFIGLAVDLGQIYVAKGYLRRAADAGALAAAAQFRGNRGFDQMRIAAHEAARPDGMDPDSVWVQACKGGEPGPDSTLCPDPGDIPRKLVRVTVELDYPMTFLSLIGIYSVHLMESAVSEAAAMDVVLVIDVSESMTWDSPENSGLAFDVDPRNPVVRNAANSCHPFQEVKAAASLFAAQVLNRADPTDEEGRLAIVTFANGWQAGLLGTYVHMGWTNVRRGLLPADAHGTCQTGMS